MLDPFKYSSASEKSAVRMVQYLLVPMLRGTPGSSRLVDLVRIEPANGVTELFTRGCDDGWVARKVSKREVPSRNRHACDT